MCKRKWTYNMQAKKESINLLGTLSWWTWYNMMFESVFINSITTDWQLQTSIEPPSCFTDVCRHSLLHLSLELLCWFQIWIHHSMRPVKSDLQSGSCVILHTSAFSLCFPDFLTPFHRFLMQFQWTVDDSTGGPAASLKSCFQVFVAFVLIIWEQMRQIWGNFFSFLKFYKTHYTPRSKFLVPSWSKIIIISLPTVVFFCFFFTFLIIKETKYVFLGHYTSNKLPKYTI